MPFRTFFGATLLGKAGVKVNLPKCLHLFETLHGISAFNFVKPLTHLGCGLAFLVSLQQETVLSRLGNSHAAPVDARRLLLLLLLIPFLL